MDIGDLIHKYSLRTRHPEEIEKVLVNLCATTYDSLLTMDDLRTAIRAIFTAEGLRSIKPRDAHMMANSICSGFKQFKLKRERGF